MIQRTLLAATEFRAPGICIYGGAGLKKTHGIASLPPPIEMHDWEGGTSSVLPWVRRSRDYDESQWLEYTDADRQKALDLLNEKVRATVKLRPGPYIDIIHYDNMAFEAYDAFVINLGSFDYSKYNSWALDSLQEFSGGAQTYSRGKGNELKTMNEVAFAWVAAQERAQIALRRIRNYRDRGVFVYMTGSEDISKDYVKNPMEKRERGEAAPEAYNVRGTVNLPGKLAEGLAHIPDILCHARLMSGSITWITEPEMLPGGGAHWDAKDRYGRLDKFMQPSIRDMCTLIYGKDGKDAIYAAAREAVQA